MEGGISLIIYLIVCFLVAFFYGNKRQAGVVYTFVFCICFSPIIGAIIAAISGSLKEEVPKPQLWKKIVGGLFILLAISGITKINENAEIFRSIDPNYGMRQLVLGAGLVVFGIYLLSRGIGEKKDKTTI